jgi:alkylhydroperoxidase family enzyme
MADVQSSALDDRHKALFRFIGRVNHDSPRIAASDLEVLRASGWTDDEIYFAVTVCALFNFYNRWITATGVPEMSPEAHRLQGKNLARGYVRD